MDRSTTVLAVLVPAYLYLLGYAYLHAYYEFFGVSVSELNLGFEEVVVNSATVLLAAIHSIQISLPIFFLTLCYFLLGSRGALYFIKNLILTSLVALSVFVFFQADRLGSLKARNDLHIFPVIEFEEDDEGAGNDTKLLSRLLHDRRSELRHLISSQESHYLLISYSGSDTFYTVRVDGDAMPWLFVQQDR